MHDFSLSLVHPWTIISFMIMKWGLNFYIKTRQYNKLNVKKVPPSVHQFIQPNPETGENVETIFMKSQNYGLDSMKFSFIESIIRLMINIVEIVIGFFPIVWSYSTCLAMRYLGTDHEIVVSCVFVTIYMLYEQLLNIPLNAIDTFFIEAKHGFNKTTVKTFISDIFLKFGVSFVILTPVISAIIWIFNNLGSSAWFYTWLFLGASMFVGMIISPILIAPLFNTFTPLENDELKNQVTALANKLKFPLKDIYICDGSKRSSHSNAYFTGILTKRIVLYDTLLENNPPTEEIMAVLAHEFGHWALNHLTVGLVLSQIKMFIIFYAMKFFIYNTEMFQMWGFNSSQPVLIGMIIYLYVYEPIDWIMSFLENAVIRYMEFQADRFSFQQGYDIRPSLKRLYQDNKSPLLVDFLYEMAFYSHPAPMTRQQLVNRLFDSQKKNR